MTSGEGFADPEALLRWVATGALLAGALLWRRFAIERGWVRQGRGAIVFWIVAALLHVGVAAPPVELQGEALSALIAILAAWSFLAATLVQPARPRIPRALLCSTRFACSIDPARGAPSAPRPPPL